MTAKTGVARRIIGEDAENMLKNYKLVLLFRDNYPGWASPKESCPSGDADPEFLPLCRADVGSSEPAPVPGILLDTEGYALAFRQSLKPICDNRREMHEDIIAAGIVGNKTEPFIHVEPFDYTAIHFGTSSFFSTSVQIKTHAFVNHHIKNDLQKHVSSIRYI